MGKDNVIQTARFLAACAILYWLNNCCISACNVKFCISVLCVFSVLVYLEKH